MAIAILDHSIEISTPVATLELSGGKESKMDLTKLTIYIWV
jgi:hypothetical protein